MSSQQAEVAALKRRVASLERVKGLLKQTQRQCKAAAMPPADSEAATKLRFRAAGMASNRQRLGLSAADFGLLLGTSSQSISAWKQSRTSPRAGDLAAIAALRGLGKLEVMARLEALKAAEQLS